MTSRASDKASLAEPLPNSASESDIQQLLAEARAHQDSGDSSDALAAFGRAIDQAGQIGLRNLVLQGQMARGLLLLSLTRWAEARDDFQHIAKELEDREAEPSFAVFRATALLNQGVVETNTAAESDYVISLFRQAERLAVTVRDNDDAGVRIRREAKQITAIATYLIADQLFGAGHPNEALTLVKSSLQNIDEGKRGIWRAKASLLLGKIHLRGSEWRQGLQALQEAASYAAENGDLSVVVEALYQIAGEGRDPEQQNAAYGRLIALPTAQTPQGNQIDARRQLWLVYLAYAVQGDIQLASTRLRVFEEQQMLQRYPILQTQYIAVRGQLAFARDDEKEISETLDLLEHLGDRVIMESADRLALLSLRLKAAQRTDDVPAVLEMTRQLKRMAADEGDQRAIGLMLLIAAEALMTPTHNMIAIDTSRQAWEIFADLGLDDDSALAQLVYATGWLQYDPHGIDEADDVPEWRRVLDGLPTHLLQKKNFATNFHLLYARGLLVVRDLFRAKEHLAELEVDSLQPDQKREAYLLHSAIAIQSRKPEEAQEWLARLPSRGRQDYAVLLARAEVAHQLGAREQALRYYQEAAEIVDRRAARSRSFELQASVRDANWSAYNGAIEVALELHEGRPNQFETVAVELMLAALSPPRPVTPTPLNANIASSLTGLSVFRSELAELVQAAIGDNPRAESLIGDIYRFAFSEDYSTYLSALPRGTTERVTNRGRRTLKVLIERCQQSSREIRVHYDTGKLIAIAVIDQGGVRALHEIGGRQANAVRRSVALWRDTILRLEAEGPRRKQAAFLFESLFPKGLAPCADWIEIVPHGDLWKIPFETLVVTDHGDSVSLDDVRLITYLMPASLALLSSGQHTAAEESLAKNSAVLFVGPQAPGAEDTVPSAGALYRAFARLGAIGDCRLLLESYREECDVYRRSVGKARWLHFNAHAELENTFEPQVGLVLSAGVVRDRGLEETTPVDVALDRRKYQCDGFLSPREIQTLKLQAECVFLHGCYTLKGRYSPSGVQGLVSAIRASGAQNVIVSHWPVPVREEVDSAIGRFYELLCSGLGPEKALRAMRREVRQTGAFGRQPYAWAAFSLFK